MDVTLEEQEVLKFMKKSDFDRISSNFKEISFEAKQMIDKALPDEILALTMRFNSPTLTVISCEIYDDNKFIEEAF